MSKKIAVSESEYQFLKQLVGRVEPGKAYTTEELAKLLGIPRSRVEPLVRLLADKGLLEIEEQVVEKYVVTEEAKQYLEEGFPEEKLVKLLHKNGGELPVDEARRLLGREFGIAMANASRKGWVRVEAGKVKLLVEPTVEAEEKRLLRLLSEGRRLSPDEVKLLRRRRLVAPEKEKITIVRFGKSPEEFLEKVVVEVGALTRQLIESGEWRNIRLRSYNVAAEPPKVYPGRLHFFRQFVEYLRDVMKELGFVEIEEPPVELEFWNYDVLFQPQYHPARSPTDTFYLRQPREGVLPADLAVSVRKAHEEGIAGSRGWGYRWDPSQAARLILRSHTTAVSARVLASKPRPPFRFFSLGRVYRVETIDPRHLPEFHQIDGIASEDGISLRWLIGMLSEFLERLGFREYKFRPAYFPFTEPSIEGYVRVKGQWLEILGAGMFRPEMLAALGIDYPVAAWGMGIERLAMALYGLTDIRQLYSMDVRFLSTIPSRWWIYAGAQV
ncbi:Phenylalanyl-tRNA synthetase alpha chain [Pyrodictium delaneyi]|uniref:Phenylalanine--tRNA ligase alpha subunit n=1 Tax=Pyrodictium delaneyi TaxID=1273541 RepID=A0A0P0N5T6_9CREN|nr:phenylalanine--tRNA ligase subunit alpha [Pyrodictium delaneyi]ALL01668.1 Phenylalanyl-tRNA synthetase alpha chain [Pyrodictium delaneyi]OWJ55100.1 phenylalanyl--tRNA ligase subunit alpha [Pyrodictium delaneyi]